jgi:hypothetical protein
MVVPVVADDTRVNAALPFLSGPHVIFRAGGSGVDVLVAVGVLVDVDVLVGVGVTVAVEITLLKPTTLLPFPVRATCRHKGWPGTAD